LNGLLLEPKITGECYPKTDFALKSFL